MTSLTRIDATVEREPRAADPGMGARADAVAPTVVIVPGLRDHVPEHWQTLLAARIPGAKTVPPLERDRLSRIAQVQRLDDVICETAGPVVLVAHSAGVITTVHWAQQADPRVVGALLVTPADLERPLPAGYPSFELVQDNGWCPIPRRALPFATTLAASTDDPLAHYRRVTAMAESWGSKLVGLGAVGHLNPAGGYGDWPRAEELLAELVERVRRTAHDDLAWARLCRPHARVAGRA